ncbi:Mariner Mos1 transposase [Eumeta japonica]|uniref:Mariner Mos1 transposase n=1 Tax=Eumeta variegata TaxID=151549 RepID=A0A4C1VDW3_EUMVA|nr:Mariner Mos1 transposase [Eumeta japonica]
MHIGVAYAPEGVKNNVLNTLSAWSGFESPEPQLVRTLACLALLHALIQERRAYIPEGWSQWYDFEWGDVSACQRVVAKCGGGARSCAAGLCEALYAGRVSSLPDAGLLTVLVQDTLGEHTLSPSWKPRGLTAPLPYDKRLKTYASALSALPSLDTADLLGLPANCRIAWETKAAQNVLSGLKEKSAAEAHRLLAEACNEAALSERTCRDWFQKFKNGYFDVEDKNRSGTPKIYEDAELEELFEEDSSQTQKELALTLEVT